jgi:hypothetical protein
VLGLLEDEGKCIVELLMRSEPDELALAKVNARVEVLSEFPARLRVKAICGDN